VIAPLVGSSGLELNKSLVWNESFEVSTCKKSEAGGLMSLEGGGSLEVDGRTLVGVNGIDGDRLKKSEGKKGTKPSIAGLTFVLDGTMGRGFGFDAASRKKEKEEHHNQQIFS
jgi:hypothetical protein